MSDIKNAFDAITAKTEEYNRADAYYDGTNKEVFANQRWFRMFRYEGSDFRFNFSKTVVDSVLNRLEVAQVQTTSASADAYINQIWEQTDLKIDMNEIHRKALVYGDCYAIVWPDMNGQLARAMIARHTT